MCTWELGKYNHFREAYLVNIGKWEVTANMQLTYMIDDYYRLRLTQVAEDRIDTKLHADAPSPPADSDDDPQRDIRATGMDSRLGYEFGSGGAEDREAVQMFPFVSLFPSLLFSYLILAHSKWCRHGFSWLANCGGVAVCAEYTERLSLSYSNRLWYFWSCMIAYIEWLFLSLFPFPTLLLDWLWQLKTSAPKEGDNVTVTHDPSPGKRKWI